MTIRTVLSAALLLVPLTACARPAPCEAGKTYINLVAPNDATIRTYVEIAATPDEREKGLMFRKNLAADAGMIFIWPDAAPRAFWMKNTLIPLDMVFIHGNNVLGVVENAAPMTETPRMVPGAADAVLEVPAGTAARYGINTDWVVMYCLPADIKPQVD
ncbi:MAG: DUF192 domain-containing protein [Proteobacteria bacterium]|nr:DUF192 domain-containing protein [Pseudomonadota bacterium]